ncbi:alpha/beta hydrolase [uncultured Pseudokineococcus sp.]|uniref:alpha/beta hydrolase n=1 Tax=uncultured Pseudokineococcus sp. TaxID=1642928 RepID=UPI002609502F|nr:alpha/beta hydrolase [uncultured Pseudokineococcus sp.]
MTSRPPLAARSSRGPVDEAQERASSWPGATWHRWVAGATAAAAVLVAAWVLATEPGAVVHGHPLHAVLLALTLLVAGTVLVRVALAVGGRRPAKAPRGWRRAAGVVMVVGALGWVALLGWLRPSSAVEPALSATASDAAVTVTETPTALVLAPTGHPGGTSGTGLVLQPGARVEARAYAAVLRPLAEDGHLVVVPKQPLGIAFLALGALDRAKDAHPDVARWVVGGHSLGGTVAALEADGDGPDEDGRAPTVGLLLWGSYPAGDVSASLDAAVLSVSASQDGLTTPADVRASADDLPAETSFVVVEGAVHAFFGDYGSQPGDGVPTVDRSTARAEISRASAEFLDEVGLADVSPAR